MHILSQISIISPVLALAHGLGLPELLLLDALLLLLLRGLLLLLQLLLLSHDRLDVSRQEQVHHHVPLLVPLDLAPQDQHLAGQHPVHHRDRGRDPVVAGDHDVHELQGRVGVAERDAGDVHVGCLHHGLVVPLGIGHQQQSGLLELPGVLVGQLAGDPPGGGDGLGAGVVAKLVDCALPLGLGADHDDLVEVGHGGDDSGSELDLVVGLPEVEDVVAGMVLLVDVPGHGVGDVLGAEVHLGAEQPQDVRLLAGQGHFAFLAHLWTINQ